QPVLRPRRPPVPARRTADRRMIYPPDGPAMAALEAAHRLKHLGVFTPWEVAPPLAVATLAAGTALAASPEAAAIVAVAAALAAGAYFATLLVRPVGRHRRIVALAWFIAPVSWCSL